MYRLKTLPGRNNGLAVVFFVFLFLSSLVPNSLLWGLDQSDLDESFESFSLAWNPDAGAYLVNSSDAFPDLILYDNNHYVFNLDTSTSLLLSDSLSAPYSGDEIFENNATGPNRYLIFSPQSSNPSSRNYHYLNPSNPENYGNIRVLPYHRSSLIQDENPAVEAYFGYALAMNDYDQLLVSAPKEDSLLGKVVLFNRNQDLSFSQATSSIVPPLEMQNGNMQFGASLSTFGDLLCIAAPNDNEFEGSVFIYLREADGNYAFLEKLSDESPLTGDTFGYQVELSENWLAVSSLQVANSGSGKVSLFTLGSDNSMNFHSTVSAEDGESNDYFGHDLAIRGDTLVVGAPKSDRNSDDEDYGAAYVYEWDVEIGQWSQVQKLSPESLSVDDQFGYSVSISNDFLFVGSLKGDGNGVDAGLVYVFKRNGSNWEELATIHPPENSSNQLFSTNLEALGNNLFVTSPGSSDFGKVFVFAPTEDQSVWNLISNLDLNQSAIAAGSTNFAPLAASNGIVAVGSPEESAPLEASGGFQVFFNPGWREEESLPILAPLIDHDAPDEFVINEDSGEMSHDFNASHKFEQDSLTWSIIDSSGALGTMDVDEQTGLFVFSPAPNLHGEQEVTIQVSASELSSQLDFTITVLPVNDAPEFDYDSLSVKSLDPCMVGDSYEFELEASDVDGDSIEILLRDGHSLPEGLSVSPTGLTSGGIRISGTPASSDFGSEDSMLHSFTLICRDGDGLESEQDFSILVYKTNSNPRFFWNGVETSSVFLDMQEDFSSSSWLAQMEALTFTDPDGDTLSFSVIEQPDDVSVSFISSGLTETTQVLMTPDPDVNGERSFSIRISDDHAFPKTADLAFSVSIQSVVDAPRIISSIPPSEATEGELYAHDFIITHPDGTDISSIELYGLPEWLEVSDDNLSITGIPRWQDYNEGIPVVLFLRIEDILGNDTERSFTIAVRPLDYPPVISQGSQLFYTIDEDENPIPWTPLFLDAIDPDPDPLKPSSDFIWSVKEAPQGGVVLDTQSDGSSFELIYEPDGNFTGTDYFAIQVTEDGNETTTDSIRITVQVNSIEDDPVFEQSAHNAVAVEEYSWQWEIHAHDGDEGQDIEISSVGQLPPWLSLSRISDEKSILQGTPTTGQAGEYPITLKVEDENGNFNFQEFTLRVLSYNTDPYLEIDDLLEASILEDNPWILPNIRVSDPDGQPLVWLVDELPSHGSIDFSPAIGSPVDLTYTPEGNYSGIDSFTVRVTDGISSASSAFIINVESVPDRPIFKEFPSFNDMTDDEQITTAIVVDDGDGLAGLTLAYQGLPAWLEIDDEMLEQNGTIYLQGSPTHTDEGSVSMTFTITDPDGLSDTREVRFEVDVHNQPPLFESSEHQFVAMEDGNETWTDTNITVSDDQTFVQDLIWEISEMPQFGFVSIHDDGSNLFYLPDPDFHGLDSFVLGVTDGGGRNSSLPKTSYLSVELNVTNEPDPPVFATEPTTDRNDSISWNDETEYVYLIEALDADGTFPQIRLNTRLPRWLEFTTQEGMGTASLRGQAKVGDQGSYSIELEASDGDATALQSFELVIRIDDFPPQFYNEGTGREIHKVRVFIDEDEGIESLQDLPIRFYAYDPDPETSEGMVWDVSQFPQKGNQIEVSGVGDRPASFSYTPEENFNGYDEFYISASDGTRRSELKFEVFIRPIGDPPVFETPESNHFEIEIGESVEIQVQAYDDDSDNLSFKLFTPSWDDDPWLKIRDGNQSNSVVIYGDARLNQKSKTLPISLSVSDETGRFDSLDFLFTIEGSNQNPIIQAGRELTVLFSNVREDNSSVYLPISFDFSSLSASDPEGEIITWEIPETGRPEHGIVSLEQSAGVISGITYFAGYSPVETDRFVLRAKDNGFGYDEITVSMKLLEDSSAPLIEGENSRRIQQSEFFAFDFSIMHASDDYEVILQSGPDWVSANKMNNQSLRLSGTTPQMSGNHEVQFYVVSDGRKSSVFSLSVETFDGTPPILTLLGDKLAYVRKDSSFPEPGWFATDLHGKDISDSVVVEGEADLSQPGQYLLNYRATDDYGGVTIVQRYVNVYEDSPLLLSAASYFSSDQKPLLKWLSDDGYLLGATNLSQLAVRKDLNAEDEAAIPASNAFVGVWQKNSSEIHIHHDLSGEKVFLHCLDGTGDGFYAVGRYERKLSLSGKSNLSEADHSYFLCKLKPDGLVDWIKYFDAEQEITNLRLCLNEDGKVFLGGSFKGSLSLSDDFSLTSQDQSTDIFIASIPSTGGEITGDSLGGNGEETLLSIQSLGDERVVVVADVAKESQETYGLLMILDEDFNLSGVSFESDFENSCTAVSTSSGNIFLGCSFSRNLYLSNQLISNQLIAVSEKNATALMQFSSDLDLNWIKVLESDNSLDFVDLHPLPSGDCLGLIQNSTGISGLENQLLLGNDDLTLLRIQKKDGAVLWNKSISGDGNESEASLLVNEFGGTSLLFRTTDGVVVDGTDLRATQEDEYLLLDFTAAGFFEIYDEGILTLKEGEFFSSPIRVQNSSFCNYSIVSAPEWLELIDHGDGNATISGVPDDAQEGGFLLGAYGLNGDYSIQEIKYEVLGNESLRSVSHLPQPHSKERFIGNGRLSQIDRQTSGRIAVLGTAVGELSYRGNELNENGGKSAFMLFLNETLEFVRSVEFASSDDVVAKAFSMDSEENFYVFGHFRNDLVVQDSLFFSNGGYDLFIAKLSSDGELLELSTCGGTKDELACRLLINRNDIVMAGQFRGTFPVNSEQYHSNGNQDCFVAKLNKENLSVISKFLSFGGTLDDEISDLEVTRSNEILLTGNFRESMHLLGNQITGREAGLSSFIAKLDVGLEDGSIGSISGSGNTKSKHLSLDEENQIIYLAGEFDKSIDLNGARYSSSGALDLFVLSLGFELDFKAHRVLGGTGTDRVTQMSFGRDGNLYLNGSFSQGFVLGDEILEPQGFLDSFLARLDPSNLATQDLILFQNHPENRIDSFKAVRSNYLLLGGKETSADGTSSLTIESLGNPVNAPHSMSQLPAFISSNSFFNFEIGTGPWSSGNNDFTISVEKPSWISIELNPQGTLILSGHPPSDSETVPYDLNISITNELNESLRINDTLQVKPSSEFAPKIDVDAHFSFHQFEELEIPFRVYDRNNDSLFIKPELPEWLSYTLEGNGMGKIKGTPGTNELGAQSFSIFAKDSSGLESETQVSLLIKPNFGSESQDDADLPEEWSVAWIGTFATTKSGWSYHFAWGWVWLQPSENPEELWFFTEDGRWYWTNSVNWDGPNLSGYLYSSTQKAWIYCMKKNEDPTVFFDYSDQRWSVFLK